MVGRFLFSHFPLSPTKDGGHENESKSEIVLLVPVALHADYFKQGIGYTTLTLGIEKAKEMGYLGITVEGYIVYDRYYNT